MYTAYYQGRGRYLAGGRELGPELKLPQTTSLKEQWLEANEARRTQKRMGKMKRTTKSDSAIQAMVGRSTGNSATPTTRQEYQELKRQDVHTYQLLARGGMMARNRSVVDMESGEWGGNRDDSWGDIKSHVRRGDERVPGARVGAPVEDRLPGEPLSATSNILRRAERGERSVRDTVRARGH